MEISYYIGKINRYLEGEKTRSKPYNPNFYDLDSPNFVLARKPVILMSKGIIPEFTDDLIPSLIVPSPNVFLMHLYEYGVLMLSCIALLHTVYPNKVAESINIFLSDADHSDILIRRILEGKNHTFGAYSPVDLNLAKIVKRFNILVQVGVDISSFRFVYFLTREASGQIYMSNFLNSNSLRKNLVLKLEATNILLRECFRKGFKLSSLDSLHEDIIPESDKTVHDVECTRQFNGIEGDCCWRCMIYEHIYKVYKDFLKEVTLYDFAINQIKIISLYGE